MINHLRTLLLNQPGSLNVSPTFIGEEFVPAEFNPVIPPLDLQAVLNILFGVAPDRAMLNYRLRQYLTLIHSNPDFAGFVTALDSRITYWPAKNGSIVAGLQKPITATQTNTPAKVISFVFDPAQLVDYSRLLARWSVAVTDGSTVTMQQLTSPKLKSTYNYTITNGLSDLVTLPGSSIQFRFASGIGSSWFVEVLNKPKLDLVDLVPILEGNASTLATALFNKDVEPYRTFNNIWAYRTESGYRLSAIVLAVAYKLNTLLPANSN